MFSWCRNQTVMLPEGCVAQGQDGFSSKIEIISQDVKVLKSEQ